MASTEGGDSSAAVANAATTSRQAARSQLVPPNKRTTGETASPRASPESTTVNPSQQQTGTHTVMPSAAAAAPAQQIRQLQRGNNQVHAEPAAAAAAAAPPQEAPASPLMFEILSCSGWEPRNPPSDLVPQGQQSTTIVGSGWQTAKGCTYPQTLILRLTEGPHKMERLQLLSHHFKIASSVEFYTAILPERALPPHSANLAPATFANLLRDLPFTKLGYVALSQNKANNYKTRELKVVHVDVIADCLKIVVHKPWTNELNAEGQVFSSLL